MDILRTEFFRFTLSSTTWSSQRPEPHSFPKLFRLGKLGIARPTGHRKTHDIESYDSGTPGSRLNGRITRVYLRVVGKAALKPRAPSRLPKQITADVFLVIIFTGGEKEHLHGPAGVKTLWLGILQIKDAIICDIENKRSTA